MSIVVLSLVLKALKIQDEEFSWLLSAVLSGLGCEPKTQKKSFADINMNLTIYLGLLDKLKASTLSHHFTHVSYLSESILVKTYTRIWRITE